MIGFLISVWTSMSDYSFFYYPAVCGFFWLLFAFLEVFSSRGTLYDCRLFRASWKR